MMDANPIRYTDPLGDAILYFNGWRAGSLVFNDTKYYTYDKHDYWGEIDDKFQKRLNDKKPPHNLPYFPIVLFGFL